MSGGCDVLPNDPKQPWPPSAWQSVYNDYSLRAAWYGGDMNALANIYRRYLSNPYNRREDRFAQDSAQARRTFLHVPIASDIASVSANLLFGESPKVSVDDAAAQERLETIIVDSQLMNTLVEAADSASGMGGVCLKVNWDRELANYPILSIAQVDCSLPEWQHGILTACTFWRVIPTGDDREVWRLLERHEPGVIYNGLYCGTPDRLGAGRPLEALPETADLEPQVLTGIDGLLCRYIPNLRPNRKRRGNNLGRSDTDGLESLMDTLDEVYTSWLRDVRLGRGRIIVPEGMLQTDTNGTLYFDSDQEAFTTLNMVPSADQSSAITISQFEIRAAQHQQTALDLLMRIVTSAGYSPQTFGLNIDGQAESGTALKIRENRTYVTSAAKAAYWKAPLEDLLELLLLVDRTHLGGSVVGRPSIEIQDGVRPTDLELATSVEMMYRAAAASTEERVRKLHPDWTDDLIQTEVQRIQDEQGLSVPDVMQAGVA
jgi:A118 family predicted phage portal protein